MDALEATKGRIETVVKITVVRMFVVDYYNTETIDTVNWIWLYIILSFLMYLDNVETIRKSFLNVAQTEPIT